MIKSPFAVKKPLKAPDVTGAVHDLMQIQHVLQSLQEFKAAAETAHQEKLAQMDEHIQTARVQLERAQRIQRGPQGIPGPKGTSIKGDKGDDGETPPVQVVAEVLKHDVIEALKPHIPPPLKGDPGEPGQNIDLEAVIPLFIQALEDGVITLKPKHIEGLNTEIQRGVVRGGGDTVAAGTGVTFTIANGVKTINAAGGGGFTTLTATETPNSSITVFTFAGATAQPSYIVSDNVWMKATSAAGTVNWTWNQITKKITLSVAPQDDIFAVV